MPLLSFIIGFICGFIGSVPVAGPIAALVFAKGIEGQARVALGIAWGAALPEALVAGLAAFGVGMLMEGEGPWIKWGAVLSALVLIGVGLWLMVGLKMSPPEVLGESDGEMAEAKTSGAWGGAVLGLSITALNPTLIVTWSSVSGGLLSLGWLRGGGVNAMAFGLGAGLGIGCWFTAAVAALMKLRDRVSSGAIRWVGRFFGALLLGGGLWALFSI